MYRIGFACKWMETDQTQKKSVLKELELPYNTRSTTARWLSEQEEHVAIQRLKEVVTHNVMYMENLVTRVGKNPRELRMVRFGSDILPMYTHAVWKDFYATQPSFMATIQQVFRRVGIIARKLDVRVSFHPGHFTVLASDRPEVVKSSIEEFEYHADMLRWMGYGKNFQDAKCNVHISGKLGPAGIMAALPKLSEVARNCITIENCEMTHGIEESLELTKHVALVLDVHHHWVREGEYIDPKDERVAEIISSWRGVRPAMHYSMSREDLLVGHCVDTKPDMDKLLEQGYKKQKLRAHSDFMWNKACNKWAEGFLGNFDIMVEAKAKNLASYGFQNEVHAYK